MKSSYYDKLKRPEWQKKRLEILKRDNFTCQKCKDTETQLHVHHLYYVKDRDPWGYPDLALMTLCSECHKSADVGNEIYNWEYVLRHLASTPLEMQALSYRIDEAVCGPSCLDVKQVLTDSLISAIGRDPAVEYLEDLETA